MYFKYVFQCIASELLVSWENWRIHLPSNLTFICRQKRSFKFIKQKVLRVAASGLEAARARLVDGGVAHVFSVAPPKLAESEISLLRGDLQRAAEGYVYSNSKLERIFLTSNFSNCLKAVFWQIQQ